MPREYPTLLELVGGTPLVRLQNVVPEDAATVLGKLEFLNPGGSIKDRIAITMIEDAEREGKLKPGGTIVEPTSGNTGTGLAIVAALKGYRCIFTMPDKMSREKISLLKAFGAEVIICPYAVEPESPESYYSVSDRLAEEIPGAYKPDQYRNPNNPRAHYETTGPEILEACPEIDAFVAGLGTSGTLMGVGRYLRERKPGVRIVAAEPLPGEAVQGLRSLEEGFVPEIFDPAMLDAKYLVSAHDAIAALRDLVFREGIFAGPSCGAVLVAAARVAREMNSGTIVVLLPDGGWKYLSAGTFTRDLDEMEGDLEGGVNWW